MNSENEKELLKDKIYKSRIELSWEGYKSFAKDDWKNKRYLNCGVDVILSPLLIPIGLGMSYFVTEDSPEKEGYVYKNQYK